MMNKYALILGSLGLCLASLTAHATKPVSDAPPVVAEASDQPFIDHSGSSFLVFASDPQYPWTTYSDDGGDISASGNQQLARKLIEEQYQSIADFRNAKSEHHVPVMINGDMTAFGHGWQRDYLYTTLDRYLNGDYYFGLGNHDYGNNVDDCASNGCARDSLFDLRDRMQHKVDSMDLDIERTGRNETWRGSLAYSKQIGDVQLIQLNNFPNYRVNFDSSILLQARTYDFRISDSLDWLEKQLEQARANNRIIILNMHDPQDWEHNAGEIQRFKKMINDYQVSAVFAGHLHKVNGKRSSAYHFGEVPAYLSGSASQSTYLIAQVDRAAGQLKISTVKNNNWADMKTIDAIALPDRG